MTPTAYTPPFTLTPLSMGGIRPPGRGLRNRAPMTLDHAPSTYTTPVQWAADWLTPDEQRGLRASERMEALRPRHTAPAPAKPLHASHSARQKRIRARRIQTAARVVTYLTIATLLVVATGYAIRIACALYGN